ncbi:amidohydrolase family protein [Ferruginibacter sp. SUN002]|uniref:amidohydrolase family protein n=1 Tax=Ferruginibacter sp. SUN002 TaxID=2937789 RepID=UPI003D3648DE
MIKKIFFLSVVISFSLGVYCQTYYITNVTIVDVEKKQLIPKQTVIIKNGVISTIASSKKMVPHSTARMIDGYGKFLLPGMTDAHIHFFQSGGLYTRPDAIDLRENVPYEKELDWVHTNMEDLLKRYLREGITNVIDVGASDSFLIQRKNFKGRKDVPSVSMTGALLTTWEPDVYLGLKADEPFKLIKTIAEAKKAVQEEISFNADFIKVWYITEPDSVEASARAFLPMFKVIIEEAHKNGLKVTVHATERITAQLAVENGCDFLVHQIEDEVVSDDFIKLLKDKNVILCPTLIVADGYDNTFAQKKNYTYYDLVRSNPTTIGSLLDLQHLPDTILIRKYYKWATSNKTVSSSHMADSIRKINLKKMIDAGVIIAAGTDAGNIGTQHATSFIKELKAMQSSGLNNWQIIQSATINGAKVLGKEDSFGSITVGKKANMVLLDANPIDDLDNLTKINSIINKGIVINPDTLVKETTFALVQRQINAYNTRNIEAFLEPYADNVEFYNFSTKSFEKGKNKMRKAYAKLFATSPDTHIEIKEKLVLEDRIITKERIFSNSNSVVEQTKIYFIKNNKIKGVY